QPRSGGRAREPRRQPVEPCVDDDYRREDGHEQPPLLPGPPEGARLPPTEETHDTRGRENERGAPEVPAVAVIERVAEADRERDGAQPQQREDRRPDAARDAGEPGD